MSRRLSGSVAGIFYTIMSLAPYNTYAQDSNSPLDCPQNYIQEAVSLVNFLRERRGMSRLEEDPSLMKSSRLRASQMATSKSLTHSGWKDSILKVGYSDYSAIGENIASGYSSPTSVVNGWYKSSGHRENMLDPGYNFIGIGCAVAEDGSLWWTQHFAEQN